MLRAAARLLRAHPRLGDAPSAARDGVLVRDSRRHRRALRARARKGSFRARTTASSSCTTETAQGTSFDDDGRAPAAGAATSCERPERRRRSCRRSAACDGRRDATRAVCSIGLKPRDERDERRRDDQGAAAEARRDSGHRRLPAEPAADSASAGACRRACISSRCRAPTSTTLYQAATQLVDAGAQVAAAAGRHDRPADRQSAGERRDRPRARRAARRHRRGRSRPRCTTRTARARCRRSTRRTTSTGS